MNKAIKTMRGVGASSIVLGTICIVAGITVGVCSIVNGGRLLSTSRK